MLAGLPSSAWILLLAVIVIPLAIELTYFFAQHRARRGRPAPHEERP